MSFAWWCSGLSNTNWTWSPSIYPGIWILVGVFFFSYFRFINPSINNKQSKYFLIGMILFWIFTDSPDLGLRPVLDFLNLKAKLPKPLISILSLFLSEFNIDLNMAFTESSTSLCES